MGVSFKNKLIASTALAISLAGGYARRVYAAPPPCYSPAPNTYTCSGYYGAGVYMGSNAGTSVTTAPGFSVYSSSGNALEIGGYGPLVFTDEYQSSIFSYGPNYGLVMGTGDYNGLDGSITVNADSIISNVNFGIHLQNSGSGDTNVDFDGTIQYAGAGIFAQSNGGDLNITTGSNTIISAADLGIHAIQSGTGNLTLQLSGDIHSVYATTGSTAGDLNITTKIESVISGSGIAGFNDGAGDMNIRIGGNVITDTSNYGGAVHLVNAGRHVNVEMVANTYGFINSVNTGMYIQNLGSGMTDVYLHDISAYGDAMYIYTAATTTSVNVTAGGNADIYSDTGYGLLITHSGSGDATMDIYGGITAYSDALNIVNKSGTTGSMNITLGQGGSLNSSDGHGMFIRSFGDGGLSMQIDGNIYTYTSGRYGITARNAAGSASVNTGVYSTIRADTGIDIFNYSTDADDDLTMDIQGQVYAQSNGVYGMNYGGDLVFTSGGSTNIQSYAMGSALTLKNRGTGTTAVSLEGSVGAAGGTAVDIYAYSGSSAYLYMSHNTNVTGVSSIRMTTDVTGNTSAILNGTTQSGYGSAVVLAALGGDDFTIANYGDIASVDGTGLRVLAQGSGNLSISNFGAISGGAGLIVNNQSGVSDGIYTSGTITGTNGTAILIDSYYSTAATPIVIAGGYINGDVYDNDTSKGFSPVTVTGGFTSNGNFTVSDFDIGANGIFTLDGSDRISSLGAVGVEGRFIANGPGAQLTGDMAVEEYGYLDVEDDFTITGDLANSGKTAIFTGKTLTVDTMSAAIGDLYFGFNTAADTAQLIVSNGPADITNQTLHINVTGATGLADNEQALLISSNGSIIGGPGGTRTQVDDDSILWDFDIVDGTNAITQTDDSDLFLIAHQAASISYLASTQNNENTGDVLMTLQNTTDPELSAIVGNMNGASSQAAFNTVLESAQSVADGSEAAVVLSNTRHMLDAVAGRLNDLQEDKEAQMKAGLSDSGEALPQQQGLQAWAFSFGNADQRTNAFGLDGLAGKSEFSGFGRYSRQSGRGGIDGYDAKTGGAAFGIDTGTHYADKILGLTFSYAHSEVESKNANRAENEIDGIQIIGYGRKLLPERIFADLMLSYAQNQNDTTRHDVGGVPGLTASGGFTSYETGVKAALGRHIDYSGITVTPTWSIDWLHYKADSYTETGAGGANLSVDSKSLDSVEFGFKLSAQKEYVRDNGATLLPEAHAGYFYDLAGDPLQKTSAFTGGGPAFTTSSPDPSRHRGVVGLGVAYQGTGNWDYALNYELSARQDLQEHQLVAKAVMKF